MVRLSSAALTVSENGDGRVIAFEGALSAATLAPVWRRALAAASDAGGRLTVDLGAAASIDTSGAALLLAIERTHGGDLVWQGLSERGGALLARLRDAMPADSAGVPPAPRRAPRRPSLLAVAAERVGFLGAAVNAFVGLPRHLRFLRSGGFFHIADLAGRQALPLTILLGFLIGVILAFQSAIPMRQFGADIYVAALVAISLFRELGPLIAAIIMAGRTGSAFAAELGTMTVNEEVAALRTMGIDPQTMLVIPRMVAAMLVMPALTLTVDIAGVLGMAMVLTSLGFPPQAILNQVTGATGPPDLLLGLGKSIVFGAAIGLIGCRAGIAAGTGPRAVGEAATSAVVGGIIAIILLDGLFAVLFYRLGV